MRRIQLEDAIKECRKTYNLGTKTVCLDAYSLLGFLKELKEYRSIANHKMTLVTTTRMCNYVSKHSQDQRIAESYKQLGDWLKELDKLKRQQDEQ